MRLNHLALENYRSYAAAELHLDPGLTIVAGPNGAGKTNLLEAIFVAIAGRRHRANSDAELVRHGADFGRVRLDLGGTDARQTARVELIIPGEAAPAEIRKRLTVNGVARRSSTVGETARAVLFRPEEMLLLVGAPSERRRFLTRSSLSATGVGRATSPSWRGSSPSATRCCAPFEPRRRARRLFSSGTSSWRRWARA